VGIGANPPKLHAVYNPEMEAMSGIISRVIGDWLDSMIVPATRKKSKTGTDADADAGIPEPATGAELSEEDADDSADANT